ncbi:hypothetical protein B0G71_7778 [Paraburkholderia sp. BL27I4N3]|nr:hypothetical protein B0G71_7778 [Paraburkholderia sp. BL27I4N3]
MTPCRQESPACANARAKGQETPGRWIRGATTTLAQVQAWSVGTDATVAKRQISRGCRLAANGGCGARSRRRDDRSAGAANGASWPILLIHRRCPKAAAEDFNGTSAAPSLNWCSRPTAALPIKRAKVGFRLGQRRSISVRDDARNPRIYRSSLPRRRHYLPAALFTAHCLTMLSPSLNLNVTGTVEPTVSGFFSFSNIT